MIGVMLALPLAIQKRFKERLSLHLHKNQKTLRLIFGSYGKSTSLKKSLSNSFQMDEYTLSMLFHLFYELEHNQKSIANFSIDLSFENILSTLYVHKHSIYMKTALLLFMNSYTRKLIHFSQLKKQNRQEDNELFERDEDNERVMEWITATNEFIQR
jgi:hypothetical protein